MDCRREPRRNVRCPRNERPGQEEEVSRRVGVALMSHATYGSGSLDTMTLSFVLTSLTFTVPVSTVVRVPSQ